MIAGLVRALVVAVVAVGASAPPVTAAPPSDQQLRVGSFNIDRDRGLVAWRRAVREFRAEVDVAGLQEVSSADRRRFLVDTRWAAYGATPGPDENPVIWDRRDFRRLSAGAVRIAGRQGSLPASYATVVRLVHRATGQRYAVLNVHLLWGGVRDGRKVPGQHARYRYYVSQVRGLARAVEREQGRAGTRVLVVGDFNVDHQDDRRIRHPGLPTARLGAVGLVSAWDSRDRLPASGGTSTMRAGYIDNVWAAAPARSVRSLRDVTGGQHRPVVATYAVARPRPTAPQRPPG